MSKVKKNTVDPVRAHREMMPSSRERQLKEEDIKRRAPLNAGVTALFYPNRDNQAMLVLILRKTYKGVHSGQIGFPGGREEPRDADILETALRETHEEVGVHSSNIKIVCPMTKIYIPPSNFWVYPFLGMCKNTPRFRRQESEVEELLLIKLEDLLNDEKIINERLTTSYSRTLDVPAFALNNQIVWGATAMMLNEVKSLLKTVL